jgi:heme A synthase
LISAAVVTGLLLWTITRALTHYANVSSVRRLATTLLALLVVQLSLGFAAYLTRVQWGKAAVQPELSMVISTVSHVAVGALVLATSVLLALEVRRSLRPAALEAHASSLQKAIPA